MSGPAEPWSGGVSTSCILHYPSPGGRRPAGTSATVGGGPLNAAILTGPGKVEVRAESAPAPEPGDALVEVDAVGFCGTDRKIFSGAIPVHYPRIMGHEIAGTVVTAPDGSPVAEGTRV